MVSQRKRERGKERSNRREARKLHYSIIKHLPLPLFVLVEPQPLLFSLSLTGFSSTLSFLKTVREEVKVAQKINRISAKKFSDNTN